MLVSRIQRLCSAPHALALAAGQQKSPERRIARARWRNFGEYAFLEDSRYASQRKK
jgi:hypothetical protein